MRSTFRRLARHHIIAVAYTALLFALGGTAYAANLVTSENILDETIRSQDIGPGAVGTDELASQAVTLDRLGGDSVTGTKVADGTLWGVDIRNGSLTGHDVADGSLTGYDVADGSIKGSELGPVTVTAASGGDPELTKTVTANCPSGRKVLGGGGEVRPYDSSSYPEHLVGIAKSAPADGGNGWTVRAEVIDHPAIPEFTLSYNDDGVVDGFASWIEEDNFSYRHTWVAKAWAICV